VGPCAFTGSIAGTTLTVTNVSGAIAVGTILQDSGGVMLPNTTVTAVNGDGSYTVNLSQSFSNEPLTGGGNVFIFGPYPDSAYTIQGVYYQQSKLLSTLSDVNWMIANCPWMLHAACMVEVAKFLKDPPSIASWTSIYQSRLKSVVDGDKAERWAASTMQIELG